MAGIQYAYNETEIYAPCDIKEVLTLAVSEKALRGNRKKEYVYNIPCAFDVETTSFYRDTDGNTYDYIQAQNKGAALEKCSTMYVWQLGINGYLIIGRTWNEFVQVITAIRDTLHLCMNKRLIIYVHNLSYEFQFIRKLFTWDKVFAIDLRKPIYAISGGIEFRCSYLLSGYNLEHLGKNLQKYKCEKLTGDLDYSLLRHSNTALTTREIAYCVNDIQVVMGYIQELIEQYGDLHKLPITKTGFVRKFCRKLCLQVKTSAGKTQRRWDYIDLMRELQITGMHEFDMLQRAFAGGFTHANADVVRETHTDVASYDFTSSYPSVMVAEKYPMSEGVRVSVKCKEQFTYYMQHYCCIFDVEFTNIFASETYENPISASKCYVLENGVENNGRVVCAARLCTTLTNVDFPIIKQFYTWENLRVGEMYCYRKDYLPTPFVRSILELYETKTKLKGVAGAESEYLNAKEMLNSCYGMCVTNPLRDNYEYADEWNEKALSDAEKADALYRYNNSKNRFLFYPWGVFVTAYARRNLFSGIYEIKEDYLYSDTDSIKLQHHERHKAYFDTYNKRVQDKLRAACLYHNIPFDMCVPKTIKGVTKPLGVWDFEGVYKRFKTLGAKRYMTETEEGVSLTISGVNKKAAVPYLLQQYGTEKVFDAFDNYLEFPPCATGKNIHTYIDYEQHGTLIDYTGVAGAYDTATGVHLEPTGYNLSLSVLYLNYLIGRKLKAD